MQIVFKSNNLSNRIIRLCFIISGFIIFTSIFTKLVHINYFISCILSGLVLVVLYDLVFLMSSRKSLYNALMVSRRQLSGMPAVHVLNNRPTNIQPFYYTMIIYRGLEYIRKYNSMRWNYLCVACRETPIKEDMLKYMNRSYVECNDVEKQLQRLRVMDLESLQENGFKTIYEYYCTYMYLWDQLATYDPELDPYPELIDGFRFLDIRNAEIRFYKQLTDKLILTCTIDGEYAHIYKYKVYEIEDKNKFLKGVKLDKI